MTRAGLLGVLCLAVLPNDSHELIFVVGELREWVREHEEIVQAGPTDADGRLRVAK